MSHIIFLFLNARLLDSVQIRAESRMCSPSLVLQAFGMHSKVRSYRHVRWKGGSLRMPKVANCESEILILRYYIYIYIYVPSSTARYACLMSGSQKRCFSSEASALDRGAFLWRLSIPEINRIQCATISMQRAFKGFRCFDSTVSHWCHLFITIFALFSLFHMSQAPMGPMS